MFATRSWRNVLLTLAFLLGPLGVLAGLRGLAQAYRAHEYPYGWSHCCILQLGLGLRDYAAAHDGHFPAGGATPEASLGLLYADHVDAELLAGKTIPPQKAERLLAAGQPLTADACDWNYVEGLRTQPGQANLESHIVVLWDKVGLGHNGKRLPNGGHSVLFMNGSQAIIDQAAWPQFLAEQQKAWAAIRAGETPQPPWNPDRE